MEALIKQAKKNHTKEAWLHFYAEHKNSIESCKSSKPLKELFKILSGDKTNLKNIPVIFGSLIQGCLTCWDLELGKQICEFCSQLSQPSVTIPAAKLHLESGHPASTRKLAQKSLRLANINIKDRVQLEMLIANSYAEEGKHKRAINSLVKTESQLSETELKKDEIASIFMQIARLHFFLGNYSSAVDVFKKASKSYIDIEDWESATTALFNTAACYHNSGDDQREEGFTYVERSRRIAETHNLKGPLSHIESFYGLDAYHHGNFVEAREYFLRSLELIPASDKSYRRLHVLSMLTLTHLVTGKYKLAKKVGQKTLKLASLDKSERQVTRYISLDAELLWEAGEIPKSQKLLRSTVSKLKSQSIHNLEELFTLSRFLIQTSILNESYDIDSVKIDQDLKRNIFNWGDFLHSKAQILITQHKPKEALVLYKKIKEKAEAQGNRYHEAIALLGKIEIMLMTKSINAELDSTLEQFEAIIGRIGNTPLRTKIHIVRAAIAYQRGDFPSCRKHLKSGSSHNRINFIDKLVINTWLATIEGRSSKLTSNWETNIVSRYTRIYFAPSFKLNNNTCTISTHYTVDLQKHRIIADVISFLLQQPNLQATAEKLQKEVWKQSIKAQGWQQKVRNTVMRVRDLFPQTIAPLIIHKENICLFSDAISFQNTKQPKETTREELIINELSTNGTPSTSRELSTKLNIPIATTKRTLKKLLEANKIKTIKSGRSIYYEIYSKK